ncbi:tRNA (adenine(22)-N(1))-methyltransferase [Lapidilactobacillus luobeiensis]|uniref:tRNA (adenine(22)-N(1))-methyltransferase n=1 Tax=Lapidilactobacillus luobeiensis TaxID=2950371 RepID=UPI0021C2FDF4|nr:tRNA (adenine(22)-N(1))-methyltransferase TrmK [Lapidilactobacillus luobeiensis]
MLKEVTAIQKLSRRLQAVADLTAPWSRIADIGSDHAHLPIYLAEIGQLQQGVAGEVIPGPFAIATEHVATAGLSERITVRLADGLAAIAPADHMQCAVLAGMGGFLITQILARSAATVASLAGLVLQPNQNVAEVRQWLAAHQWRITAEKIVFDEGHCYQMMQARPSKEPLQYTALEALMGPCLLQAGAEPTFVRYWQFKLAQRQKLVRQLQQAQTLPLEKLAALQREITLIEAGLAQVQSLK